MAKNVDLMTLLGDKSVVNAQLTVITALMLLSSCSYSSLKDYGTKYIDCTYVDEENKCNKPKIRLFDSKYGSISTRVTLGKKYMLQYKYKF